MKTRDDARHPDEITRPRKSAVRLDRSVRRQQLPRRIKILF